MRLIIEARLAECDSDTAESKLAIPGFRVSLYPSPSAAKPIQSVLVGRLLR
jgi:hypothetical protein